MLQTSIQDRMSSIASAFNALAADYDANWTFSLVGRIQRQQVWQVLAEALRPGDRILELGCGTGLDAVQLARAGMSVHALDVSPEMLQLARKRIELEGSSHRITSEVLAVEMLSEIREKEAFDAAFSNFGVFNCVEQLSAAAAELARLLRPRGRLVLCFMGRFCAWETVWQLLHGRPRKAFRRLSAGKAGIESSFRPGFRVFYPSISQLAGAFHGGFDLVSFQSIGVLIPPSYMEGWARRRQGIVKRLAVLDGHLNRWPVLRAAGDHRLAVFVRRS